MLLKAVVFLALFGLIGVGRAWGQEIGTSSRLELCLNGNWLRSAGGDGSVLPHEGWENVRVPEFHADSLKGSAWFRLDFAIADEFDGDDRRILLRFIRVRHYAKIFLNGVECGENYGSRAPFEIDVTSAVWIGQENRLEVWVHDCSGAYAMKDKVIEDLEVLKRLSTFEEYRDKATIAEDVFLISRPAVHVSDVLVMPSVREKELSVRLTVTNDSEQNRQIDLKNSVFLGQDKALDIPDETISLAAGESHTAMVFANWADPQMWGYPPYGEPVLYHLETRLLTDEGAEIDQLVTRFGFREFWTEDDKIIFNGKPLRILGYWVPEGSGRSIWTLRMAAIQWAGCNAIHNHAEQRESTYYDVADELGLLVWDADFCGGPLGTTRNINMDPFSDVEMELARQYPMWAKAVANHPSVAVLMMGCLLNNQQVARLAEVYRDSDPTRLIHSGGDIARPPMDLSAYASHFNMAGPDPLDNIRETYEGTIDRYSSYEGKIVPLINKEIWYNSRDPETNEYTNVPQEKYAEATAEAIRYLASGKLAGFILYSQTGFRQYRELMDAEIQWPSRSGESQHPTTSRTGGLRWSPDFVNFSDPEKSAFEPLATAKAMRETASEYIGHQMPVAKYRRPEAIITVLKDGKPLADAYVYAHRLRGAPGVPTGMRTDENGTAWFALREAGKYRFSVRDSEGWQSIELDAPLQPIDVERGGLGTIIHAELSLVSSSAKNSGPPFPRIANCYGSGLRPGNTAEEIDEIARIDLLIGGLWCNWSDPEHVKKLHQRMAEVREKNPDVIILEFSVSAPYANPADTTFPESGWLKQPDGRYIDGWPGTRMINLLRPETRAWVVDQCLRSVKERGMDGVFIDCMAGVFDSWACNIASQEPYKVDANEDGQPDDRKWLDQKWVEAKTEIAQQVREAIGPDVPFMTNQGGEWSFSSTNGVLFEDNLDYVLDGKMSWDSVIEPYLHWTENPRRPNITTIVSSSGIEPPFNAWEAMTDEERGAMLERGRNLLNRMRFGLATTLMGDGYFAYDLHTRWRGQRWWYPEYDAPLGYPKGKAEAQPDGTWRREFDGGTVIVNPTVLDARVRFDERRLDVSSGKVDTEFVIPAQDGRLLNNTEEEQKPGTIPDPDPLFTLSDPKPIVQRGGRTLCRFSNSAAYFDNKGWLVSLTDGGNTFAVGGGAVLVSDERWRDFSYEDTASRMIDESKAQFSGKRVEGDVKLSYEQTVSVEDDGLTIQYRWEALTDGSLHAWRQQIDFPVKQYTNGQFRIDDTTFKLPAKPVDGPISDHGVREIAMIQPDGSRAIIKASHDIFLQDERMYKGKEYRILFVPMGYESRSFRAGDEWEYTVRIEVESVSGR